jgi:hypothetical protein
METMLDFREAKIMKENENENKAREITQKEEKKRETR